MTKKTEHLKNLEKKIVSLENDNVYYRREATEKRQKIEELERKKVESYRRNEKETQEMREEIVRKLFEVVRWHVNPDTAKYPFRADKGQRDDKPNFDNMGNLHY